MEQEPWIVRRWGLVLIWAALIVTLAIVNIGATPDGRPTALDQYIDRVLTISIWSPIADFIRRNQAGLLASLVLSFMLEIVQGDELKAVRRQLTALRTVRLDDLLQRTPPAEVIARVLKDRYRTTESMESLVSPLLSTREPYWGSIVRYQFSEISGSPDWYRLQVSQEFFLRASCWLVCLTGENEVGESVGSLVPEVSDLLNLSDLAEADAVARSYRVVLHIDRAGTVKHHTAALEPVRLDQLVNSHHGDLAVLQPEVRLWRARFPSEAHRDDGSYHVSVSYECRMRVDDHSFQWLIDRPMHVQEVEMDARRFGAENGSRRFYTQYSMLSNADARDFRVAEGRYLLRLHRWMPQGTSLVLVWRDA